MDSTTGAPLHRVERLLGTTVGLRIADPLPRAEANRHADTVFCWLRWVDRAFRVDRRAVAREVRTHCGDLRSRTDGHFDLPAYVRGWAAQVASDLLAERGVGNHLISAGRDVRARGGPAPGHPWRIGIRHPSDPTRLCWVLACTDLAVATSESNDPGTILRSVTVTGPDLGTAVAYARAGRAMGRDGAAWLSSLEGYSCAVVSSEGRCFRSRGLPAVPPAIGHG